MIFGPFVELLAPAFEVTPGDRQDVSFELKAHALVELLVGLNLELFSDRLNLK